MEDIKKKMFVNIKCSGTTISILMDFCKLPTVSYKIVTDVLLRNLIDQKQKREK